MEINNMEYDRAIKKPSPKISFFADKPTDLHIGIDRAAEPTGLGGVKSFSYFPSSQSKETTVLQKQKNCLAALGRVTVNIVHELTQPISAIRLLAENALGSANSNSELADALAQTQQDLKRIVSVTESLSNYIHQLKQFTRNDNIYSSPVWLQTILDNVLLVVEPKRKECNAVLVINVDNALVCTEAGCVSAILVNLICNAFEAVKDNAHRQVTVTVKQSGDTLGLTVRDLGPGLSPEILAHLFNPFMTTKSSIHSMGVGLALSRDLARQMGAYLRGANHPEGGAEFSLELSLPGPSRL
jgi:two-component system, NtrC family, C4-dicarboxylate transport sensor histidine kinase DctB